VGEDAADADRRLTCKRLLTSHGYVNSSSAHLWVQLEIFRVKTPDDFPVGTSEGRFVLTENRMLEFSWPISSAREFSGTSRPSRPA
jgi:hypothetical protein